MQTAQRANQNPKQIHILNQCQARKNSGVRASHRIGFAFDHHWLRNWREFAKQSQSGIGSQNQTGREELSLFS